MFLYRKLERLILIVNVGFDSQKYTIRINKN